MKKEQKEKIGIGFVIIGAWAIVAVCCLLFYGIVQMDRKNVDEEVVVTEENIAVFYNMEKDTKSTENKTKELSKKSSVTDWISPKVKIEMERNSEKKRAEEMSPEEAAEAALKHLHDFLEMGDCENQTVKMSLVDKNNDYVTAKRYYSGHVYSNDGIRYLFSVDAVNGNVLYMDAYTTKPYTEQVSSPELEAAMNKSFEENEKKYTQPWISTNDFVEMTKPGPWNKLAKKTIKEYGLNYGKTINTTFLREFVNYLCPVAVVESYLDEIQGDTQRISLGFNIETKKLVYFINYTLLGEDNFLPMG